MKQKFEYEVNGFELVNLFTNYEFIQLKKFTENWIYSLIESRHPSFSRIDFPLSKYHDWCNLLKIDHGNIFIARNRHCVPPKSISRIIQDNPNLHAVLESILPTSTAKFWDEGLGWLAFRIIRPSWGDGYPTSKKSWGPAKKVVSAYLPIIGLTSNQSIGLVVDSHKLEFEGVLPDSQKFCKDEYRLSPSAGELQIYRQDFDPGQGIIFHPDLLHTEEIPAGDLTRVSLEFRVL